MNEKQNAYYHEMARRNRLIPVHDDDGSLVALFTFYIGDDDSKYIRNNPWTVLEDDEKGTTLYIDQFLSKKKAGIKMTLEGWKWIKQYFKKSFPQVQCIKWARKGRVKKYVYSKNNERCGV